MDDPEFETAFQEYSQKREGKDFWKSDIFLKIENDIKTGNWKQVANADNSNESRKYKTYSSEFDEYMNLPASMAINNFKEWFNGRFGRHWGDGTPSKKMFEDEVINKFPTVAILVSKHAKIRGLINNFKTKHPEEFLSLKTSYMLDMLRADFKSFNNRMSSYYSEIVRIVARLDNVSPSGPITDIQRRRINKLFFKEHVYNKQQGGKSKKTRRARRKVRKTRRLRHH